MTQQKDGFVVRALVATTWLLALLVLCSSCVRAQTVWRVNLAGGPVAHFTDLPPAVAAAQPGDTIICWIAPAQAPNGWGGYTAPVIDKPIRLIGLTTMTPSLPGMTTRVNIDGVIQVRNIALGETCVVSNVYLTTTFKTATQGIRCEDCAGSVVLDGVTFFNSGYAIEHLRVERCANVLMQGAMCTLGATGWFVADSNLAIQRSQFWVSAGAFALPGLPPVATNSFAPLYLLRSTATLSNCTLRGHPGNIPPHVWGPSWPAVAMDASTVIVGPYGNLPQGQGFTGGVSGLSGTVVRRDPRSVVATPWGTSGMQVIVEPIHATATSFSVVADEPYTVWVDGPASGFALLGFDRLLPAPAPTPLGDLWLDPFRYTPVAILALAPGTGQGSWSTRCPASAPVDIPFVFQSLTLAPDGTLAATLPSPFTVGWEYYRIP
jgi:hypothetical protein